MIRFLKKYWFLIFLAAAATFLFLLRSFLIKRPPPRVTSLSPAGGETISSQEKEIKINLNRPVEKEKTLFSLTVTPSLKTEKRAEKNQLIFVFKEPLLSGEKYFFTLNYRRFPFYSWSYRVAAPLPSPSPSPAEKEEKGNPDFRQEIIKKTIKNYPLIRYLPYETDDFAITYSTPLTLEVTIKKGDQAKVKEEVYRWLEEKGIDPESHQIEWK